MRKKVLIIEDNALNMKLVRSLLQLSDIDAVEAENAEKGIKIARSCKPDLILMDIQLPGMDGLQAAKKIKSDLDLNNIPIVALTSYAMQGDEEKAIESGCVGYITKPIDTKKFLDAIGQYLN